MKYRIAFTLAIFMAGAAAAHHSDAGLDMEALTTVEGSVTGFYWRNPHVYFTVEVTDETGETEEWSMQLGSIPSASRMGWTRDTLSIGENVVAQVHAAVNGRPYGLVDSVDKESGDISGVNFYRPAVTASTTTLEGLWMTDTASLPDGQFEFDAFILANIELTEKGRAALEAFDPLSAENPMATCVGRPTPAMLISSTLFPIEILFPENEDIIVIQTEYWDEVRTVHMDGRGHPDISERLQTGHSIGHWDGETLVVETTNFADHRAPYQIGVPSGAQKRVVEHYTLIEDGTRIAVEFEVEDPEYMTSPIRHARELIYSPHIATSTFGCDPEAARMFLRTAD
jgi:hypothetical protein